MAHFSMMDAETGLPQLIPVVWVVAQAVDRSSDHWQVLNARGGIDDVVAVGTQKQCHNFIQQVKRLLRNGEVVIDPDGIDLDIELLEML